jgi:hypothetical protein
MPPDINSSATKKANTFINAPDIISVADKKIILLYNYMNEQIGYAIFLAVVITIIVIIVLAIKHHKKKEFQSDGGAHPPAPTVKRVPAGSACPPGWADVGIIKKHPEWRSCYTYA